MGAFEIDLGGGGCRICRSPHCGGVNDAPDRQEEEDSREPHGDVGIARVLTWLGDFVQFVKTAKIIKVKCFPYDSARS